MTVPAQPGQPPQPQPLQPARDPRPALIVAGVVAGYLFVRMIVGLSGWMTGSGPFDGSVGMMSHIGREVALQIVPLAAGVFLLLLLWPVRTSDRVIIVLLKGLAATAAGALLVAVVGFGFAGINAGLGLFRDLQYLSPFAYITSIPASILGWAPLVMLVTLVQHLLASSRRRG